MASTAKKVRPRIGESTCVIMVVLDAVLKIVSLLLPIEDSKKLRRMPFGFSPLCAGCPLLSVRPFFRALSPCDDVAQKCHRLSFVAIPVLDWIDSRLKCHWWIFRSSSSVRGTTKEDRNLFGLSLHPLLLLESMLQLARGANHPLGFY